ncbi:hypothetical protein T459_33643 [Capsicum annuum]|uniref:Uncharacterized protein n=1 Tax=Capsicum annuum TaxID=4072 RepID=A0A1U8GTA6_CAPAN|nr:uncharacterized protein LOC107870114 isoform X2 [Capsicum annuum]KAF3637989.1 putative RNA-dependent RNA polymerase 6-like isoform X1 [Capsicum annuum]PHT62522.1 hypothetical protein T459_33643 [Capsicum annuum]
MASSKPPYRYANAISSKDPLHYSSRSNPSSPADGCGTSRALTRTHKPPTTRQKLGSLVKKLVEHKSKAKGEVKVVVPADYAAKKEGLSEVEGNARSLGRVLRSERELLTMNKEQEKQINELKQMLEQKNIEAEKLKDVCLKQREEIKSLKNAVLFPDDMSFQLHELLETQRAELKQANQLIPSLQDQVKADKYSHRGCYDSLDSSRKSPEYNQEAANSLVFSSENTIPPGSPDDMLLMDLNPCLTPYSAKTKSKEFEFNSPDGIQVYHETSYSYNSFASKASKSSDCCCQCSKAADNSTGAARGSDESKSIHNMF